MISTLPPPPKSTNLDERPGKNDTFVIDRKEKKMKGRREGGKKERRERKEEEGKKKEGKKERRQKKNINVFLG